MRLKEVLYVEPQGSSFHAEDPLVLQLREMGVDALKFFPPYSPALAVEIAHHVRLTREEGGKSAIIINTFLVPEKEGVDDNRWEPSDGSLSELLGHGKERRLCSLDLLWKLWPKVRISASLLVTTNRVRMTPRSCHMLMTAFDDGRVSDLYRWSDKHIVDLVTELMDERATTE